MTASRPYGSWDSPLSPQMIVSASTGLGEVRAGGDAVWWSESRPEEGGRVAIVRRLGTGGPADALPEGYSARTRVHEYGGGAWWLAADVLFFANWDDQRLYRWEDGAAGPVALTRDPAVPHGLRYADGSCVAGGRWSVCVRESHEGDGEAVNELVGIPTRPGEAITLVTGPDFVSSPRPSPDGRWLAWLQWDHPRMPWDGTELWVAELADADGDLAVEHPVRVAGGPDESIFQPEWSPEGVLHFVSDRADWWDVHRFDTSGRPGSGDAGRVLAVSGGEVGTPQWVFGMSRYCFLGDGRVLAACASSGFERLVVLDVEGAHPVDLPFTSFSSVRATSTGGAVMVVASPLVEPAVVALEGVQDRAPVLDVVRPARDLGLETEDLSAPEAFDYATADGSTARGLYYAPTNATTVGPQSELPPLLVSIHGGPTSAARTQLQLGIQFWTSRGFAVVDVNYRGSTGFGRAYRRALDGLWGVADVEDCAAAAAHLAAEGLVDGARLAIHGGSAGGFTTLCALISTDAFAVGTSSYGVTDLEALARDTHKFESRYLDTLVGPYPQDRARYVERSPITHADRLDRPLLVLQGLEDEIVPPAQAEVLVDALRRRGVTHAYVAFEGEQHGFRRAETIVRALDAELVFYARVFGFEPAGDPAPLDIENG